ncbi:MAG: Hsp20/alpha crystallin family protein [Candidatus Competibacterales bacterium]
MSHPAPKMKPDVTRQIIQHLPSSERQVPGTDLTAFIDLWFEWQRWANWVFAQGWLTHTHWNPSAPNPFALNPFARGQWDGLPGSSVALWRQMLMAHGSWSSLAPLTLPALDIVQHRDGQGDTGMSVYVEVPGVAPEDLTLIFDGQQLTIKGRFHRQATAGAGNCFRAEMLQGDFERSVTLPQGVDATAARAQLDNGVLHIALPPGESRGCHRIPVLSSTASNAPSSPATATNP